MAGIGFGTGESHALDAVTPAFEVLAEAGMLGRFAGAVKSFDDYQGTSLSSGHILKNSQFVSMRVRRIGLGGIARLARLGGFTLIGDYGLRASCTRT